MEMRQTYAIQAVGHIQDIMEKFQGTTRKQLLLKEKEKPVIEILGNVVLIFYRKGKCLEDGKLI
ncbi:hypothetical protein NECAME_10642 [Necator americanus]|uniref:Uncharacterized protein n=1 Tax=Necator americanus TaxID=51031 RepID=W2T7X7_NECAM|nr:hypothetical protein NECAME_10642 [Necator americanus]ETN77983.1 hypothetical protein NECAME_10642 [Necator americanus]